MNHIEKYFEYIKRKGMKGLLPQNMPDNILHRMLEEVDSLESDIDDTPPSTLFLTVLFIHKGKIILDDEENTISIKVATEELMEKLENYKISLSMEHMRRIKRISIPSNSLPTLNNILNSDRKVELSVIN